MAAVTGISLVAVLAGCHSGPPPEPKGIPGYYPGVNVQRKQAANQAAAAKARVGN